MSFPKPSLTAFLVVSVVGLLLPATVAQATNYWKNTVVAGNWSTGNNWSGTSAAGGDNAGAPTAGEAVNIVFTDGTARSVTYDVSAPSLGLLSIDLTGPGAATSTLSISGNNNLTTNGIVVGGYDGVGPTSGRGALIQSAGTVTTSPVVADLFVGWGANSLGVYTLSGGALVNNLNEYIGFSGTGTFNHSGGTNTINANAVGSFFVGHNSGGTGTYNLSGTGTLVAHATEYVGYSGTGFFNQTGGTNTISGAVGDNSLYLGYNAGSNGTYTISAGSVSATDNIHVGYAGAGTLNIQGAGSVSTNSALVVGYISGSHGAVNQTGGTVTIEDLTVGYGFGSSANTGVYTISAGTLLAADDIIVGGQGGAGTLNIQGAGFVSTNKMYIGPSGNYNLNGGTLRFNTVFGDISLLNYIAGTIQLAGNRTIGSDINISTHFGVTPIIPSGKGLTIEGTATLAKRLTIDGGSFTVGQLVNAPLLDLRRGTLTLTNQAVTISPSGLFGSTLDVNDDVTINVTQGMTNQGIVTGDGQIGGTFANAAAGELRGEPGKSLNLTGANNTNAGRINLLGGLVEFTQNLTNNPGGLISGNGSLKTTGLVNQGTMNFAGTANVLGDVTNSAGGKIISGGGGATIFYDDVINNGEIRTSTNGFTVFFGAVSGSGAFTGAGTVNFEGDLTPGNSPAAVSFGGDVVLGPDATLAMELGGTAPGTQYDQMNVAGELALGGTLQIILINGFTPSAGQTFDILNGGSLAGAFSSIELPTLPGLTWDMSQLVSGMLGVVPGLSADFNLDGAVDAADLAQWQGDFGLNGDSDADDDGDSDGADFLAWQRQLGTSAPAVSANAPVPEPATLLLFIVAAAGIRCMGGRVRQQLVNA